MNRRLALSALCGLFCATAGAGALTVSVQTSGDAPIADAAVVLEPLDARPDSPPAVAVVDQINKRFVPHMTVVQTGAAVSFPNSDRIRHQVYSFSPAKAFNLKLYAGSPKTDVVFDKPGLVVLGCNIHDNMVGFIAVVDTPYFGTSGADGNVTVQAPPGRYRLRVWHAAMSGPVESRAVTLGTAAQSLRMPLTIDHSAVAPAAWLE